MTSENLEESSDTSEGNGTDAEQKNNAKESIPDNKETSEENEIQNAIQNGGNKNGVTRNESNQNEVVQNDVNQNGTSKNGISNPSSNEKINSADNKKENRLSNYMNNIKISKPGAELSFTDGKDKEAALLSESKTVVRFSPVWKQVIYPKR